jgi:hypothetical protein
MKIITLSLLLLSAVCAQSATVAVARGGLGVVALYGSTALSTGGYYVAVGSFATVPTVENTPTSVLAAVAAFNEFASATSPTAAGGPQGAIVGEFTGGLSNAALFNGKEIFILVGNAATKAESTDFAILKGSTAWTFTADVSAADSISVTLRDVAGFDAVAGAEVDVADPAKDQVQLWTTVPEVSSSVLMGLFGLGLMSSRRR